jgi:hypothetical protein
MDNYNNSLAQITESVNRQEELSRQLESKDCCSKSGAEIVMLK